jgi:hypothetical protein
MVASAAAAAMACSAASFLLLASFAAFWLAASALWLHQLLLPLLHCSAASAFVVVHHLLLYRYGVSFRCICFVVASSYDSCCWLPRCICFVVASAAAAAIAFDSAASAFCG